MPPPCRSRANSCEAAGADGRSPSTGWRRASPATCRSSRAEAQRRHRHREPARHRRRGAVRRGPAQAAAGRRHGIDHHRERDAGRAGRVPRPARAHRRHHRARHERRDRFRRRADRARRPAEGPAGGQARRGGRAHPPHAGRRDADRHHAQVSAATAPWSRAASPISPGMVHERLGFDFDARQHARSRRPDADRHGAAADPRQGSQARHAASGCARQRGLRHRPVAGRRRRRQRPADAAGRGPRRRLPRQARRSRPRSRRASTMAISPRCSICRAIAGATSSRGKTDDRRHPDRARQAPGGRRHRRLLPPGAGHPAGARRRPGADPLPLPVARPLHAPAHDRAALLHAALRARQAADRRLGGRGGRVEEPALRQGRHGDRHAELGKPHAP